MFYKEGFIKMKYGQFFGLLLFCIANINLASANVNNISSLTNPPTSVTVYFNANGGNSANMPTSVSIEYGFMYGDVTGTWNWDASKSGYYFIGWNTAADGSGYFVGPVSHCAETTTHTLYAIFEEASSQDVSLCPDGSAVISASSGARQYEWLTTAGLDDASSQKPTLSASALTPGNTYDYVCKLEAPNCIYNYDFNLGNVGFYSDYQWSDTAIVGEDNLYKQRTYGYISDAHNAHPAWFNIRSHNNDGGKFMICNGGALPDDIVWEEAVKVEPNTNYVFSAWVANVFIEEDTVAAELQLYVNGTAIGGITKVIYHDWIKIEAYWNSGSNQYAALQIKNHATRDTGNDFGLDDIEFYPADGSYDTITVTVNPTFTPGAISSTGQTIHQGGTADTIGNVTSAAGGDGNISYQWFEGSNAIEGATSASYKPGSAYTETMGVYTFTRKAKDATCATTFTTSEGSYVLTTIEPVHTVLGLTRTGKEVDCSTMDPEEDKTITEHGKIVTSPRVTRNGKLITTECSTCGVELSITDTVTCVSITLNAAITAGDPTAAVLKVYSDVAHTTQVGSDISAIISDDKISAVAANLNCHTRYYFLLETTEGTETCTFDWTDSTRDMTMEKVTTCTVASVRALSGGSDLSHEHLAEGTTDQIDSVYDHEGNAYAVVQIGNQCWLKQNMRATTSPSTGHTLMLTDTSSMYSSSVSKCASNSKYYMSDKVYGLLYNWCAALDTFKLGESELATRTEIFGTWSCTFPSAYRRGICPQGWHIPSDQDWMDLTTTAGVSLVDWNENPSGDEHCCHGKLAGGCAWPAIDTGSHPGSYLYPERNITGFSILPSGYYTESGRENEGVDAGFICSSMFYSDGRCCSNDRTCYNGNKALTRNDNPITFGFSVRCVRDVIIPEMSVCEDTTFGTVTLKEIQNAEKIEFVQGSTVVKTISNPASEILVSDLAEGNYRVKVTSSAGDTLVDNAYVKHTYTHCTGTPHVGTIQGGKYLDYEWGTINQIDSVSDHEGNVYEVVQIGNQCWLKENMRTTQTNTGVNLTDQTGTSNKSTTEKYYYVSDKADKYGYLYNYPAATNICPSGWHLPSDAEWKNMVEAAGVTDNNTTTGSGLGKLVTSCDWQSVTGGPTDPKPGNYEYTERNISGFSALPAGEWNGDFYVISNAAEFWTATKSGSEGWYRAIGYADNGTHRDSYQLHRAYSVRCVRDIIDVTANITHKTCNAISISAKINNVHPIVSKQVCAYKNSDFSDTPVCANSITSNIAGDSIFATIVGLDCNTRYHIKVTVSDAFNSAVATLSDSTQDLSLNPTTYCTVASAIAQDGSSDQSHEHLLEGSSNKIDLVFDHQGNDYKVVEINGVCVMRQNMRCNNGPSGANVYNIIENPASFDKSNSNPIIRYPKADFNYVEEFGFLYNYPAALDVSGAPTSFAENYRGICPKGWHLPTENEINTIISGITSDRLSTSCYWDYSGNANTPGNFNETDRNNTGFSMLPVGAWDDGGYKFGTCAFYWTLTQTTPVDANHARGHHFQYNGDGHWPCNSNRYDGYAVRCVRNLAGITLGAVTKTDSTLSSLSISAAYTATKTVTSATICAYTNEDCTEPATPICVTGSDVTIDESTITGTIEGLDPNTQYYVKVTATTEDDNASNVGGSFGTKTCIIPILGLCETCNEGTITVKVSENVESIVWRNASNDSVSNSMTGLAQSATIPAGVYTATAKSSDGCTVTRTAVLGKYVAHPCTVTSLRTGTPLGDGKYANKEYGTNNLLDSVSDHEGNVYRVVQIGTGEAAQCWLAENMRATTEPDGTNILQIPASGKEWSEPRAYYNDNDAANYAKYGCLYNWPAAMNGANSEGARGICPDGWHIPTEAEWEKLCENAGVGFSTGDNAGKLAGGCDWLYTSTPPTDFTVYPYDGMRWIPSYESAATGPGDYSYAERNSTGFSALPAGDYFGDAIYGHAPNSFSTVGFMAEFWCSTMNGPFGGFCFLVHHSSHLSLPYGEYPNNKGYSVRCLRDNTGVTLGAVTKTDSTLNSLSISAAYTATKTVTSATICAYTNEDRTEPATPICATGSDVTIGESTITGTIKGLEPNTQYYVKVTATTEDGTESKAGGSFGTKACIYNPTLGLCETCNEGTITVKVSENVGSIVWRNASNDSVSNSMTGLTQSASIPAGIYTATAKSSDGCTVTRTAVLGKYVAHPCTVTSLRTGTPLGDGKYANKEYGTNNLLDSVSDHEGNVYRVVQIGNQCWLAENMRATTEPDGTSILQDLPENQQYNYSAKLAFYYDNNEVNYAKYGCLYTWLAAMNGATTAPARGICPEGWHVPTDEEWITMEYAASASANIDTSGIGNRGSGYLAAILSGGCDWPNIGVLSQPNGFVIVGNYSNPDRNLSGFNALPAGFSADRFYNDKYNANFWSATSYSNKGAYYRHLDYYNSYVRRDHIAISGGHSVRCVRDNE